MEQVEDIKDLLSRIYSAISWNVACNMIQGVFAYFYAGYYKNCVNQSNIYMCCVKE